MSIINKTLLAIIYKLDFQLHFHFEYKNAVNYGFTDFECRHYHKVREYNADEFVSWTRIMAGQLTILEPYKSLFLEGIRDAILSFGNRITLLDDNVLYLARKH